MYDAIIIGARCAGSPTAILLARKGFRVLLVDRAVFPSDTVSSHYVHQAGVARLRRWGLLDAVVASRVPPVWTASFDAGEGLVLRGSPPPVDGVAAGLCTRRRVIDQILVEAAAESGAEVRDAFTVTDLTRDHTGRVTGIRGHAWGKPAVTESARIVIGADGLRSIVARAVEAPYTRYVAPLTCNYYAYWSGVRMEGVEMFARGGAFIVGSMTNDGLALINVLWPHDQFERVRGDVEGHYLRTIEQHAPGLFRRLRAAQRAEKFVGTGMIPNYIRVPFGAGWALAGDAGCHKDPITAQGMTDAFRDADLLATAVTDGLSGARPMIEALADYQRQRDAAVLPMFQHTLELAKLRALSPLARRFLAALRGNQPQIDRFFGTISGAVAPGEFFAQANVHRILAA